MSFRLISSSYQRFVTNIKPIPLHTPTHLFCVENWKLQIFFLHIRNVNHLINGVWCSSEMKIANIPKFQCLMLFGLYEKFWYFCYNYIVLLLCVICIRYVHNIFPAQETSNLELWMSFSAFVNNKFEAIFIVITIVAHHMTAHLVASKVFFKFKLRINDEYITIPKNHYRNWNEFSSETALILTKFHLSLCLFCHFCAFENSFEHGNEANFIRYERTTQTTEWTLSPMKHHTYDSHWIWCFNENGCEIEYIFFGAFLVLIKSLAADFWATGTFYYIIYNSICKFCKLFSNSAVEFLEQSLWNRKSLIMIIIIIVAILKFHWSWCSTLFSNQDFPFSIYISDIFCAFSSFLLTLSKTIIIINFEFHSDSLKTETSACNFRSSNKSK